jgi:hypothetical protein
MGLTISTYLFKIKQLLEESISETFDGICLEVFKVRGPDSIPQRGELKCGVATVASRICRYYEYGAHPYNCTACIVNY